jgi:hypothetical protein
LKQKNAVVAGDIPGSFRLPGSDTSLRIYGFAEAHMVHDFKKTAPGDTFTNLQDQPLNMADPTARKHSTKFTAQTSRLGIESSTPTSQGAFNAKLEMDFYAFCGSSCNRDRLRIRHAYGEYGGFLIGQTWSTFMDLDTLPETVDFNGPMGSPFGRKVMLRYTYNDPQLAKFAFALEDPGSSTESRVPNIVARVDKSFDWGSANVRLLAHEKRTAGFKAKYGWGFGTSLSYKLSSQDLLMGQFSYVEGDADMMYGSRGFSNNGEKIIFDQSLGLILGWGHVFSDQLRSNLALGLMKSKEQKIAEGGFYFDNKKLIQSHFSMIYTPIKNIDLGGEFIFGRRKTFDGDKGDMVRFDLMGKYSF